MKKTLLHLMLALCAAASPAQDVIVFKNGDTLTGKILKQDTVHVYFKSDSFGSVSLQTRDISEIQIEAPGMGEIVIPADAITEAEPVVPGKTPTPTVPSEPKEKSNWKGQAGLAIALRESNTLQRSGDGLVERDQEYESYRIYGNVDWTGERNKLEWNWTYRYGRSDVRKNDDYLNLTQNYQHDFTKTYYTTAKTVYQKDFRRGIDREYLQTAELGINWFNRPKFQFSTSVGGGYHTYDRIQSQYSGTSGKFILDESIRWQIIHSLTLFQKYTHLGSLEKYHSVFTSGLENKLIRDVFLRLEYRLDHDTDVDYDDKSYYDKALLTSLLYKF
jgi:hypothetical protein